MSVCEICFENKQDFVTCTQSDKHQWCSDCYNRMLLGYRTRCPFCRAPMYVPVPDWHVFPLNLAELPPLPDDPFDDENEESNDIPNMPSQLVIQRQNAEYFEPFEA